jgi:hypothetical protein
LSGTKKHIDQVFAEGLKNFSLLVSNKDMEAIDDKTSAFKDQEEKDKPGIMAGFELEVSEHDWLKTKAKLETEKLTMQNDGVMSDQFRDFELAVSGQDWQITKEKLQAAKKRRVAYWWWLSAGMLILVSGALFVWTDAYRSKENSAVAVQETSQAKGQNSGHGVNDRSIKDDEAFSSPGNQEAGINDGKNLPAGNQESGIDDNQQAKSRKDRAVKKIDAAVPASGKKASGKTPLSPTKGKTVINETTEPNGTSKTQGIQAPAFTKTQEEVKAPDALVLTTITEKQEPVKDENMPDVPTLKDTLQPKDTTKKKDPEIPGNIPPALRLYVGAVSQIGIGYRHLAASNDKIYNQIRNKAEKPFTQYAFGFELGIMKGKNQWNTGVQSTVQTWTSNYNYSYKIYDSLPYKDTAGKVIGYFLVRPRDTAINEQQVIKINKIQIPFEMSRLWSITPRMNLITGVGGIIGFTTRAEGQKLLNPVNRYLYPYEALKKQEKNLSLAPSFHVGLQYELNKYFMLQGSVYGNYSISNRFRNGFGAADHPYTGGISIKLLYLIK